MLALPDRNFPTRSPIDREHRARDSSSYLTSYSTIANYQILDRQEN
ncbi:hypothetical protein [Chamaesiphon sp. VAR_69_metabat_338]|nr:hypothetical protein [Chamaesiphon sp. VAR_69_metabat_338]